MELDNSVERVNEYKFEPIKGYPMLNWKGKRPFKGTKYFPAQLKEVHGDDINGWLNKIFWGDNIQVMSHLLKEYRGKVDLVYIDPPFDSKADYKKKIKLKGKEVSNDTSMLEEKQYTDMWSNDEYLQFMYERLVLIRELLSETGSIYLHCDPTRGHYIKIIMDEIFGQTNFMAEVCWKKATKTTSFNNYGTEHDSIYYYSKSDTRYFELQYRPLEDDQIRKNYTFTELADGSCLSLNTKQLKGCEKIPSGRRFRTIPITNMNQNRPNLRYEFLGHTKVWAKGKDELLKDYENGLIIQTGENTIPVKKQYLDTNKGVKVNDLWTDIANVQGGSFENTSYPTQKPESLLSRIIEASSEEGDLIFDCFMGSGTTMAVAQKLGRKFIGADINLGAIQTSTKRLLKIVDENKDIDLPEGEEYKACGFEVFNVNNYDVFRNPVQARDLLIEALEIDPLGQGNYFDGMKDGQKVKIMPVNRIVTKKDVSDLITNLDYKEYEQLTKENSTAKVDDILLVCMGHDPEMTAHFKKECSYNINIDIYDILKDGSELVFKRESEAKVVIDGSKLTVEKFYPNTLLEKLRQDGTEVEDYREMVESIMIDTNYDGSVFEPTIVDIPEKKELVSGEYELPDDAGTVAIKITDLLSETYFEVVSNG